MVRRGGCSGLGSTPGVNGCRSEQDRAHQIRSSWARIVNRLEGGLAGESVYMMVWDVHRLYSRVVPVRSRPGVASRGNYDLGKHRRERCDKCRVSHLLGGRPRQCETAAQGLQVERRYECLRWCAARQDDTTQRDLISLGGPFRQQPYLVARWELERGVDEAAYRNGLVAQWGALLIAPGSDQPPPPSCPRMSTTSILHARMGHPLICLFQ